jgi:hypothetical protein
MSRNPEVNIVAFVGLPFTGKSTSRELTEQLLDERGVAWQKVYFGRHTIDEVARRDAEDDWGPDQATWTQAQKEKYMREFIREQHGLGAMANLSIHEIDEALAAGRVVLIDDLYSEEERVILADKYGEDNLILVAMAADWKVRVERAKHRPHRPYTEAELAERDDTEIRNLHKAPPIARAHFTIVNNSFDKADLAGSLQVLRGEISSRVLPDVLR